jgi:hypothetical protein
LEKNPVWFAGATSWPSRWIYASNLRLSYFLGTVLAYGPQNSREQSSTLDWISGEKSGISGEKSGMKSGLEKNPVFLEKNPVKMEENSVSILFIQIKTESIFLDIGM